MQSEDESWVGLGHWSDVAAGLRLFMAYMITLIAFTAIVVVASIAIASGGGGMGAMSSLGTVARISGVIGLGISVFGLVALERYSRIAPLTGARSTAKAALYLGIASLLISLISLVRVMSASSLEEMGSLNLWDLLTRLLGVIQMFCFVGSMRTCAGYIGRLDLHQLAGTTMVLLGTTVALVILSQIMTATKALPLVVLLGLGMLGIGIWCVVYLMLLLSRLAKAVTADAHLPATFS